MAEAIVVQTKHAEMVINPAQIVGVLFPHSGTEATIVTTGVATTAQGLDTLDIKFTGEVEVAALRAELVRVGWLQSAPGPRRPDDTPPTGRGSSLFKRTLSDG